MSPEPYWSAEDVDLYLGDCLEVLAGMEAESVDAVVTDPPYGLEFMSVAWDTFSERPKGSARPRNEWGDFGSREHARHPSEVAAIQRRKGLAFYEFSLAWAEQCYRVLKPGGFVLAFGGTRTWHRLVCAIEDAGFEIRDSVADLTGHDAPGLMWVYGSGFPKSLDVAKAIDKAAGASPKVVAEGTPVRRMIPGADQNRTGSWIKDDGREFVPTVTEPATAEAAEWSGWGTALKPAWEPIAVGRKPLAGTVAQNVLTYGTGALNIGACRVAGETVTTTRNTALGVMNDDGWQPKRGEFRSHDAGRWPSNVLFTHSEDCRPIGTRIVRGDNRKATERGQRDGGFFDIGSAPGESTPNGRVYADAETETWECADDCPVSELDRQSGVLTSGGLEPHHDAKPSANGSMAGANYAGRIHGSFGGDSGGASRYFPVFRYQAKAGVSERPRLEDGTAHNTVKPVDLMAWLVRLVSRRGALILDPFGGSGATAEACVREGRRCVLIEREPKYAELIKVRLTKPIQPGMFDLEAM